MIFLKLSSSQQPSIAPYCLRSSAGSSTLLNSADPPLSGPLIHSLYVFCAVVKPDTSCYPQAFTKLLPIWPCYLYYLKCPVTSSHDNAILDINTQLKGYLPSETFPHPSTRYNQVSHFIKAHLLSTYYVLDWLEGPDGGRGRKQERCDLCFQRDSLLCRCD